MIIYLAVFGLMIGAFIEPILIYNSKNLRQSLNVSIYLLETCVTGTATGKDTQKICRDNEETNEKTNALTKTAFALYITFIILAGICFLLYLGKQYKYCNIIELFLLFITIGIIIIVIVAFKEIKLGTLNSELGNGGILAIVASCLMIVKILYFNTYIRKLVAMK
jgi:hypothetical protein